jgi:hypothetical protein
MEFELIVDGRTGEVETIPLSPEVKGFKAEMAAAAPAMWAKLLREERNKRLAETDYLALSDLTLTDEMRAYRQALRDLPANTADPANPVWPVKPGGDS